MILLTIDEIIVLHEKLLTATGGAPGVRDRGLLESAVFGINASFEDIEQYPTVEEKAARLAYALVGNHAFVDGNKRIGMLAMLLNPRSTILSVGGTIAPQFHHPKAVRWVRNIAQ